MHTSQLRISCQNCVRMTSTSNKETESMRIDSCGAIWLMADASCCPWVAIFMSQTIRRTPLALSTQVLHKFTRPRQTVAETSFVAIYISRDKSAIEFHEFQFTDRLAQLVLHRLSLESQKSDCLNLAHNPTSYDVYAECHFDVIRL